jgi:RNA methyltransferase, TrmH family
MCAYIWIETQQHFCNMPTLITSVQNPRVKHLIALRERHQREADGLMLVEGYDELTLALAARTPHALFYCPDIVRDREQLHVLETANTAGTELVQVNERVFEKIAYRANPDGWLGVFPLMRRSLSEIALSVMPLLIVAEGIEKPGNLGAILRTADAARVDGLISCDPVTDLGNPNVVRASKGALFSVPVVETNATECVAWLKAHDILLLAATPQAQKDYSDEDMRRPIAIVVGAEKPGLTPYMLEHADVTVSIPMLGRVNSLNVSIATALLVYEALKQRRVTSQTRIYSTSS